MKTVYKYSYYTQIDSTHWLCNADDGHDMGQIYYSPQCECYVYEQSTDISSTIIHLGEVLDFMKQL